MPPIENRDRSRPAALADLAELVAFCEGAPVSIRGHTHDVGDEAYNDDDPDGRARNRRVEGVAPDCRRLVGAGLDDLEATGAMATFCAHR